jgi:hypothetical protein
MCWDVVPAVRKALNVVSNPRGKTKKKPVKEHKEPLRLAVEDVPSSPYMAVVWKYLTEALCSEVFKKTRIAERQRKWTLHGMIWFWIMLLQGPFASQTQALHEARRGKSPWFPNVEATPEAFFQKTQSVRPVFFQNVFRGFNEQLKSESTACYERDLPLRKDLFPDVFVMDGSRLAKVARMLKVARSTTKAIIPGSMEAVYDLRHGTLHELHFDTDGCVGEMVMFEKALESVPKGAMLINDRYYGKPYVWRLLAERELFMLTRHNRTVKKRRVAVNTRVRTSALSIDDWLVDMGGSQGTEPVRLRWVRIWGPGFDITLITNVLDPRLLTPKQMLTAYRHRWTVERMFLAMKEILSLNHLFNCSPAAVGQQVYATAILYNALRVSQGQIATAAGIAPERLSPDKLFPLLMQHYLTALCIAIGIDHEDGKDPRRPPSISQSDLFALRAPWLRVHIRDHLVEMRSESRRQRRYCKGRSQHTSYDGIAGAKRLLAN